MAITPIPPTGMPGLSAAAQIPSAVGPAAIGPTVPTSPTVSAADPTAAGSSPTDATDFPGLLKNLLGQLNGLAQNADATAAKAATGQDVDLHQLMMSMETAGLGFDLAVQVRNRLVEAYQEVTRMQV